MTSSNGSSETPIVADAAPRPRLIVEQGRGQRSTVDCRRVVTLIGSRPGCKLTLKHRRVAPVHLAIVNTGMEVLAVDLVTPQGTLLNELRMEHEKLADGDLLTVDPWVFRVRIDDPQGSSQVDAHPFDLEPTPHAVALEHITAGRILQANRKVCVIGRRTGCDIIIPDNRVSRTHCLLFSYFGYPIIFDLLSHNQTLVNDVPVAYQVLKDGDLLTIGETVFRVRLIEALADNGKPKRPTDTPRAPEPLSPPDEGPDMISIEETEGSQQWHIVDSYEKTARKR